MFAQGSKMRHGAGRTTALACLTWVLVVFSGSQASADCPYAPDPGLFITDRTTTFNLVPSNAITIGAYAIRYDSGTVRVTRAGAEVAAVDVRQGMNAWYLFYPASGAGANRFLIIDRHTTGFGAATFTFEPVLIDLSKWSTGLAPLTGRDLFSQSYPATMSPFLHVSPSPGNGLAVFTWIGTNDAGGRVKDAIVYRSDTGEPFVWASPFNPEITVIAETTGTAARIKDGTHILAESALPVCSPPPSSGGGGGAGGGGGTMPPAPPQVPPSTVQSVANPGFEYALTAWNVYSPVAGFLAARTVVQRRSGLASLGESSVFGIVYQDVARLVPGRTYVISAWVAATVGATAAAELSVHNTQGGQFVARRVDASPTWQLIQLAYKADASGRVRIHLVRLDGAGTIYWDDVSVAEVPSQPTSLRIP
jgi:hypothetical protein